VDAMNLEWVVGGKPSKLDNLAFTPSTKSASRRTNPSVVSD